MSLKHYIYKAVMITIMIIGPVHYASADDDHIDARQLREAGQILPLEAILKHARKLYPGKVLEVKLERENNRIVYEVEILTTSGIVKEIYIDAESGKILFTEEDD